MRRTEANPEQPDLFGEWDAEQDRQGRHAARLAELTLDCCTGRTAVQGWVDDNHGDGTGHHYAQNRCGRCGELAGLGSLMVDHDLGRCGCPKDRPTGGFPHLSVEQMCDRHDRTHHSDCECGHPWGLHTGRLLAEESGCGVYCGCKGYVAP